MSIIMDTEQLQTLATNARLNHWPPHLGVTTEVEKVEYLANAIKYVIAKDAEIKALENQTEAMEEEVADLQGKLDVKDDEIEKLEIKVDELSDENDSLHEQLLALQSASNEAQ